jgi:thiol-disulfide isomerase/thioredoxin
MPGKIRLLIVAVTVMGGLAGCSGKGAVDQSVDHSQQGVLPGDDPAIYISPGDRKTVGDVHGETLQGQPISLASYRGKVVVVNYWSSTCVPCDAEARYFQTMSKSVASKGVQFVGIDERDNRDAALNFERAHHVTYPSIFDETDAFVLSFPDAAPSTTPFTVVLDRNGGIAAKAAGAIDYTHLQQMIDYALKGKSA